MNYGRAKISVRDFKWRFSYKQLIFRGKSQAPNSVIVCSEEVLCGALEIHTWLIWKGKCFALTQTLRRNYLETWLPFIILLNGPSKADKIHLSNRQWQFLVAEFSTIIMIKTKEFSFAKLTICHLRDTSWGYNWIQIKPTLISKQRQPNSAGVKHTNHPWNEILLLACSLS